MWRKAGPPSHSPRCRPDTTPKTGVSARPRSHRTLRAGCTPPREGQPGLSLHFCAPRLWFPRISLEKCSGRPVLSYRPGTAPASRYQRTITTEPRSASRLHTTTRTKPRPIAAFSRLETPVSDDSAPRMQWEAGSPNLLGRFSIAVAGLLPLRRDAPQYDCHSVTGTAESGCDALGSDVRNARRPA